MKIFTIIISLCLMAYSAYAQLSETQGWLFITHQQKLNKNFDLLADVQLRSASRFKYVNTLLLRSALSYNFNKNHSVALGYAYKGDWEQQTQGKMYNPENRIYQQYLYNSKLSRTELALRTRLEQRWVKDEKVNFSQRARAFISVQIPLIADSTFTRGLYTGIQNELFFNIQHKHRVNGSLFDQNRTFGSVGYRWNKHLDTEVGYMYWFQKENDGDYKRNVIQLIITSNF